MSGPAGPRVRLPGVRPTVVSGRRRGQPSFMALLSKTLVSIERDTGAPARLVVALVHVKLLISCWQVGSRVKHSLREACAITKYHVEFI